MILYIPCGSVANEIILDDDFKMKEYLKSKIDNLVNINNDNIKRNLEKINLLHKNEGVPSKTIVKEELKGSLLPKIMKLKHFCYDIKIVSPKK